MADRHKAQVPTGPSFLYHSSDALQHLQLRVSLRRLGDGFQDRQQQASSRVRLVQVWLSAGPLAGAGSEGHLRRHSAAGCRLRQRR